MATTNTKRSRKVQASQASPTSPTSQPIQIMEPAAPEEPEEKPVTIWSLQEDTLEEFCLDVIGHYATIAPVVVTWAEYLSLRLSETPEKVSAFELRQFSFLFSDGQWMGAHVAANRAYKIKDMLGLDTTGMLGF